ncbi:hypothetical protein CYY_009340 [Polysphondylium violaceum]|uniref:Uncharacterized protein n=1 Tax=Polysphondylium violaceum TaxID=133409 RepID=A0A8J4PTU0_9MYCE|nr:hypothetical protein CYY_009340 [Polysphondylium violaceum]
MNNILFFKIIKNKCLFREILKLCKQHDEIGYSFYDIPMGYLCRKKKWDIFDDKFDKYIDVINNPSRPIYNNRHLLVDFTKNDFHDFFSHNTSYSRFLKIYNFFQKDIQNLHYQMKDSINLLELSILANAEIEIIDHLYKIKPLSSYNLYTYLRQVATCGSIEIFDYLFKVKTEAHLQDLHQTCVKACLSQNYKLAQHIIDLLLNYNVNQKFEINLFPLEVIKYLIAKVDSSKLEISKIPPDYDDSIDLIMDCLKGKYNINTSKNPILDSGKASRLGNLELLQQMKKIKKKFTIMHWNGWSEASNTETMDFFLDKITISQDEFTTYAINCKDLNLLRHIIEKRGFKTFNQRIWCANSQVLEYLSSISLLPPFEADNIHGVNIDIKTLELKYKSNPSALTTRTLSACIKQKNLECVDFLLSKSIVTHVSTNALQSSLMHCDFKMYNYLKNYISLTATNPLQLIMKNDMYFWVRSQSELILKMIREEHYECIEIMQDLNRASLFSIISDHHIQKLISLPAMKKYKMMNLLFNAPTTYHKSKLFRAFVESVELGILNLTRFLIPLLQFQFSKAQFISEVNNQDHLFASRRFKHRSLLEIAPFISDTVYKQLLDRFPLLLNYKVFSFLQDDQEFKRNEFIVDLLQKAKRSNDFSLINLLASMNIKMEFDTEPFISTDIDSKTLSFLHNEKLSLSCQLSSKTLQYLKENQFLEILYPPSYLNHNKCLFEF